MEYSIKSADFDICFLLKVFETDIAYTSYRYDVRDGVKLSESKLTELQTTISHVSPSSP